MAGAFCAVAVDRCAICLRLVQHAPDRAGCTCYYCCVGLLGSRPKTLSDFWVVVFRYIEFYDAMSVPMAIALRGQPLLGTPVMVKPSEAEKNLAAQTPLPAVAAMGGLPGMPGLPGLPTGGILGMAVPSRRLHISNLHVNMNEDQLKQVGPMMTQSPFIRTVCIPHAST